MLSFRKEDRSVALLIGVQDVRVVRVMHHFARFDAACSLRWEGRKIEQMGLEAVPQVGVAGFYVDVGVRRREGGRSLLLGIECDNATYHSARSARDRDRLREKIIRSRGWEIHRIWSTDWFLNQKAKEDKLEQAIQQVFGNA
ncbi:DNA helicase related protein [Rhodopirellula europaea 6C]|uniref:DNA helicase related protein n=2 Tax=Rhodopirellula TaxID=265488 RepID=M2BAJ0_9BACT|nr:DNA helicase related protein [Rhodopirellula europaea 6C]